MLLRELRLIDGAGGGNLPNRSGIRVAMGNRHWMGSVRPLIAASLLFAVTLAAACTSDEESTAETETVAPSPTPTGPASLSPPPSTQPATTPTPAPSPLDGGPNTTGAPPAPSTAAPPWLEQHGLPVPLDVTAVGPDGDEAWVFVDPETGGWTALGRLSETTPIDLTTVSGRYWLVRSPDGPEGPGVEPYPLELRAAVFDSANGDVWNIGPVWAGAVSPDGTLAAVIPEVEGSTLAVVEVTSGRLRYDLGDLGKPVSLSWSPDNVLAIVRDGVVRFARAPDWTPDEPAAIEITTERLAWSPDGEQIAFFEADGLHLADAALTAKSRLVTMEAWSPGSGSASTAPINQRVKWSPDGGRLAFTTGTAIHVVDVESGTVTAVAPEGSASFDTAFAWSPDGERLAVASTGPDHRGVIVAFANGSGAYQLTETVAFSILGWGDEGIVVYLCRCP